MKIAVNTRLLLKDKLDGIGWFSYETLKRITKNYPEHEFLFIFDRKYSEEFIFSDNITPIVIPPQSRHPFLWYLYFEWSITKLLKKHKPDLFFSPDGWISLRTQTITLDVIHDINFEHNPEHLPYLFRKYYLHYFQKFAQKANRIATVSEFTKQDIVSKYNISPNKIDVVYNGANVKFKGVSEEIKIQTKQKYTNGADYFLFIGTIHKRKNLQNLILAFDKFKNSTSNNTKLLVIGSVMWGSTELENTLKQISHKDDIILAGRASEDELQKIIPSSLAMVYPSFFEGFGIPILEGMYSEVPVITSNTTSMPEVGGDAVMYVEPSSIDSICKALTDIQKSPELRKKLIEKGKIQREKFSWDKTAEKLWLSIIKTINAE
jgi:glycosyltransferase involved in cell wall biosynthesis